MSKYRLLKDLPFASAGEVFRRDNDGHWYSGTMCAESGFIDSVLEKWKGNTDWFESLLEEPTRWRAEKDGEFWFVDLDRYVEDDCVEWNRATAENEKDCYKLGNYFQTKEQATAVAEAIKALLEYVHTPLDENGFNKNGVNLSKKQAIACQVVQGLTRGKTTERE